MSGLNMTLVVEKKGMVTVDRITNRHEDGELYVYADKFGQALNRLGAYEDTGLMPDEILELIQDIKDIKDSIDETTAAQLRAICKAAEDERVFIQDLNPGDFLYEVDAPEYGVIVCKVLYVNSYHGPAGHVPGAEIVSCTVYAVEAVNGHGKGASYCFDETDFGKLCFISREEAETALAERKG